MTVLFDLVDTGDLEVAWDLCEERGWFLPLDITGQRQNFQTRSGLRPWAQVGDIPALGGADDARTGRNWFARSGSIAYYGSFSSPT